MRQCAIHITVGDGYVFCVEEWGHRGDHIFHMNNGDLETLEKQMAGGDRNDRLAVIEGKIADLQKRYADLGRGIIEIEGPGPFNG